MNHNKLTKFLVFLMLFIYGIDTVLGEMLYFHYTTWWFDIIMHFLGGFWVGLFFIWFFGIKDTSFSSVFKLIVFVLVMGILWEVFQVYTNNYLSGMVIDWEDISIDVFMDFTGGLFAFFFFKKRIVHELENKVQ